MIHILTLSNKPNYLPDAVASVAAQTRRDFVHTVALDDGSRDWGGRYPPSVFFNEQVKQIPRTDYVCWLSDDDLLLPNYLADLAGFLDAHPAVNCVYGRADVNVILWYGGISRRLYCAPKSGLPTYDASNPPLRRIGSGMTMLRCSIFEKLKYPWCDESADSETARISDGVLLDRIAKITPIRGIPQIVMINRITSQSAHLYCTESGTVGRRDWRHSE